MTSMKYQNMDVEIFGYSKRRNVESFRVCVTSSPYVRQKIDDAVSSRIPANLRTKLNALERRDLSAAEIQVLGESIGHMLFPQVLENAVSENLQHIGAEEGLRIRLMLNSFALADLPWEYAYLRSPAPAGFLVLNRRVSLVRYEVMEGELPSLSRGEDSLRLAALLADPQRSVDYCALGLDSEEAKIRAALKGVDGLTPDIRGHATVGDFDKALAKRPHIFHFAGHGKFIKTEGADFRSYEGQGYLVLLNEDLSAREFEASKLVTNLNGCGVRLAVLGACETARRDGQNAWTGIAPALTQIDIPAVVGMQYGIRNRNATTFSEHFYYALAQGESIDWAMSAGRLAILNSAPDADERDWGVPVLYLRMRETETSAVLFPRLARIMTSAPPQRDIGVNTYVARVDRCPNVNCNAAIRPGLTFCEQCRTRLGYCTQCNGVLSTDARFCGWCRAPVATT